MSTIKITNEGKNVLTGTKVSIDGLEIPGITNVKFSHPVRDVARLELEILALGEFEIEMPAEVTLKVVADSDCEIQEDDLGTRKVYRSVRVRKGEQ